MKLNCPCHRFPQAFFIANASTMTRLSLNESTAKKDIGIEILARPPPSCRMPFLINQHVLRKSFARKSWFSVLDEPVGDQKSNYSGQISC
jgi:hypothetical protein